MGPPDLKEEIKMMVPSIWNDNLFDELDNVFNDPFFRRSPL